MFHWNCQILIRISRIISQTEDICKQRRVPRCLGPPSKIYGIIYTSPLYSFCSSNFNSVEWKKIFEYWTRKHWKGSGFDINSYAAPELNLRGWGKSPTLFVMLGNVKSKIRKYSPRKRVRNFHFYPWGLRRISRTVRRFPSARSHHYKCTIARAEGRCRNTSAGQYKGWGKVAPGY